MVGVGSDVAEDTTTAFVIEDTWVGAVTTTLMTGAVAPEPSAGRVHVTDTLPACEHDHPAPDAETKDTPDGKVSTTDTVCADDGPWFVTDSV